MRLLPEPHPAASRDKNGFTSYTLYRWAHNEHSLSHRGASVSAAVVDKSATGSTASTHQIRTDLEQLFLYDTLDRQRKPFVPDDGRPVSMYVCGVTSYDYSHVGHARVYVAFDVLVRVLQHIGREVNYVRNFTDIDDKIIARAQQVGEDPLELSGRFIDEFHRDMDVLGCMRPHHEPRATEYIASMISSIDSIVENGHAYSLENGDVYFDVQSLSSYGRLSRQNLDQNVAGELSIILFMYFFRPCSVLVGQHQIRTRDLLL